MRYTGPKLKILRRLNVSHLPALTTKTNVNVKRENKKKKPLFSLRLREKQKLRYNFGINNHQFFNYVKQAKKISGSTGERLLKLLEMRFDNTIYRLKLAPTINAAKQLITHGHFLVNKKKVNIPSYQCNLHDEISVRSKSKNFINELITQTNNKNKYLKKTTQFPKHLRFDNKRLVATISKEISLKDPIIEKYYNQLELRILYVIEFFSRQL